MAVDSLSCSLQVSLSWDAQKTQTSLNPIRNQSAISFTKTATTGTGADGANEVYAALLSIAGSGSTTLDLSGSLTNVVGSTSIAFTKIKKILIRLLSATDDSTNGTACSSITIGAASSNLFNGPMGVDGSTDNPTLTIPNGGGCAFWRSDATGWAVSNGATDQLKIANNDASLAAKVQIVLEGVSS